LRRQPSQEELEQLSTKVEVLKLSQKPNLGPAASTGDIKISN